MVTVDVPRHIGRIMLRLRESRVIIIIVVVDYGRRRNASESASLATCYYYIHVLPTLRIGLQLQIIGEPVIIHKS